MAVLMAVPTVLHVCRCAFMCHSFIKIKKLCTNTIKLLFFCYEPTTSIIFIYMIDFAIFRQVAQFHPNGKYIATGSSDHTCRLWDIHSGHCVRLLAGQKVCMYVQLLKLYSGTSINRTLASVP